MSNKIELSLESSAFNALKSDFKQLLNATIDAMQNKGVEESSINIKLDISLDNIGNPNVNAPDDPSETDIVIPMFKHKITSQMKFKAEKSGFLGGDFQITWDKESGTWALMPLNDSQMSLTDDYEYEEGDDE